MTSNGRPIPLQRTIRGTVALEGVGLHTGLSVRMRLQGVPPGSGILFYRSDYPQAEPIPATVEAVRGTMRGVTLGDGVTVATVEHLLSAAAGLGIDNLRVDLEGPELPALDGSAAGFVHALEEAGIQEQEAPARVIELGETVVALGGGRAATRASEGFHVTYVVDLPPPLGRQVSSAEIAQAYRSAIAPARTWGFAHEAPALLAQGLAKGAGSDNVLVIGSDGYLTPPRFPDEPVRHKILDLLGDLALLGGRLQGHVEVTRGGHGLHLALAREIARRWGDG